MIIEKIKFPDNTFWKGGVEIIRFLQDKKHQAYFVGGCVRDIILGLQPEDLDIVTSCRPKESLRYFPTADKIGLKFGVLGIEKDGYEYQLATFRRDDPQSDGRRPNRIFFANLEDDALRRDFTINAVYLDPVKPEFIDPLYGIEDLRKGILKVIGIPMKRFQEDHLRLLRAVRFAVRFNLKIEEASLKAIRDCAGLAADLSPDRIRDEISRSFKEGNVFETISTLKKTALLESIFPELKGIHFDIQRVNPLENDPDIEIRGWIELFKPLYYQTNPAEVEKALFRLNFSRRNRKKILTGIAG
ncbi:CCA tRNA nucleotidyltransferase [bacterium]|nr:CCA tRNA nucleotidyltransferase [bacterium]